MSTQTVFQRNGGHAARVKIVQLRKHEDVLAKFQQWVVAEIRGVFNLKRDAISVDSSNRPRFGG